MERHDMIRSAITSAIIGDALGVPVEHTHRHELALCSVKNMLGYGRYDEPLGTWSDDASMILCTMEQLCTGFDIEQLGKSFCEWLFDNRWTPTGHVFDSGLTTFLALDAIRTDGVSARESGCKGEDDNGNGSLMRILPAALYFGAGTVPAFLDRIHEISAITHAHPRAKIGCGIYALLVRKLMHGIKKECALREAAAEALDYYSAIPAMHAELKHYDRVFSGAIHGLQRDEISSSGYVVHTLEASIWCLMHHTDSRSILLEAVNLGLDTDTTGTVAGGLAGLCYGLESLPADWEENLARRNDIREMTERFCQAVSLQWASGL
jgi:ADP-ribosyl-[dinitrogen reductase] hydrolase